MVACPGRSNTWDVDLVILDVNVRAFDTSFNFLRVYAE